MSEDECKTVDTPTTHNTPADAHAAPEARAGGQPARRRVSRSGSETRQLTDRITFRLAPGEHAMVVRFAELAGLDKGAYCRAKVLHDDEVRPSARPTPLDRAALVRALGQLGRIGNNVNQIARALNRRDLVTDREVQTAMAAVRRGVAAVMAALGRKVAE